MTKKKLQDFKTQRANANKHTERGIALLDKSIRQDGWIGAVTVANDGETFDGSARLERIGEVMAESDPIVVDVDGTRPVILRRTDIASADDPRAKRLAVAANAIASADWNPDGDLLAQLAAEDDYIAQLIKSDDKAAKAVLESARANGGNDAEPQIDRAEELRVKWGVESGQLWQLGDHRLICGDCTDAATVARVMGGEKVSLIVTDPPYGVNYEGGANNDEKRNKLIGDDNTELYNLFLKSSPVNGDCALYMWHAHWRADEVYRAAMDNGFEIRSQIIWHKLKAHYGAWMAQYKQKHEPCIYCVKGRPDFIGATNEVTVWEYEQPSRNEFHPTEKPIQLIERSISNHPYKIVYEPFSGSGTTLVACENLSRRCRAIEISPAYVAVALERWHTATGKTPERIE